MTLLMTTWAMEAATEAAERLGLPPSAVVKTTGGVGVRLASGDVVSVSLRSSYPRAELLRRARAAMKAAG